MLDDIYHECGVAALYWLGDPVQFLDSSAKENVASLIPGMLLDLQNRGQLAAGVSSYNVNRDAILSTYKEVGTVNEVFRMSHPGKYRSLLSDFAGQAAIGHTRYATSGEEDDIRYAQPFERQHGRLWKWFGLAFNGNLANYSALRQRLLSKKGYHFTLKTDTEIIMHTLAYRLRGEKAPDLRKVMAGLSRDFDGAYNIAFLDAMGRMFVARDPQGFRPMCWGVKNKLFAAANESTALVNLGFNEIHTLNPGEMVIVEKGKLRLERFASSPTRTRCFFEWVYFSNVASEIDGLAVYQARAASGQRLAELEDQELDEDCVVVPVPDTAKAAADSFAHHLNLPCMEGVIRNRYVGRTFIQPTATREKSARSKYTPLESVLSGKRVFLLEDSIVRSTTLKTLASRIKENCGAKEVHVRVACPPIVGPCFYGIDMSTLGELFAPDFLPARYSGNPTPQILSKMARQLGISSLRYLPVADLGTTIGCEEESLCLGCVTAKYPTTWGRRLMRRARQNRKSGVSGRTYES